ASAGSRETIIGKASALRRICCVVLGLWRAPTSGLSSPFRRPAGRLAQTGRAIFAIFFDSRIPSVLVAPPLVAVRDPLAFSAQLMSALPPKADIERHNRHVRFVP